MTKTTKILIVTGVLIILIGGGFFVWQHRWMPKEEMKDETANWRTYTNTISGFEIKYPNEFGLYIRQGIDKFIAAPTNLILLPRDEGTIYFIKKDTINNIKSIAGLPFISVLAGPWNNLDEFESYEKTNDAHRASLGGDFYPRLDFKRTEFNGEPALQETQKDQYVNTFLVKNRVVYLLKIYKSTFLDDMGVLENIFSTFRFVPRESGEIFGWKTYTNSKFGYRIQYPSYELEFQDKDFTKFGLSAETAPAVSWVFLFSGEWKDLVGMSIDISVTDNDQNKSLDSILQSEYNDPNCKIEKKDNSSAKIECLLDGGTLKALYSVFLRNSKVYVIDFMVMAPDNLSNYYLSAYEFLYNEILSTFKFLE